MIFFFHGIYGMLIKIFQGANIQDPVFFRSGFAYRAFKKSS
jgi:hypothetical protein